MEGSLTKRKDGRWQGAVDIPNITGKRQQKYVYAATRPECRRKLNALIEEIESGNLLTPSKLTFREYAKKWVEVYCANLSPTTVKGIKTSVFTYADQYLGDAIISKILPIHIQEMINKFAKSHSEKTCRNLLNDVKGVFTYAIKNKILKSNPCIDINVSPDIDKFEYYIYDENEFNNLLEIITGTKDEIPVLLGAMCGMRLSEIMGLTWNDINFETRQINIRRANVCIGGEVMTKTTKTKNSYRTIVAPAYVLERLSAYKGVGYVYPKVDGSAENGGNYSRRFARLLKKHKLPHTRFHDLRHFNATMLLKKNVPDKEIAANLGHSDVNMTKKYQHVLASMKSRPADVMDTIIKNKCVSKCVSNTSKP